MFLMNILEALFGTHYMYVTLDRQPVSWKHGIVLFLYCGWKPALRLLLWEKRYEERQQWLLSLPLT